MGSSEEPLPLQDPSEGSGDSRILWAGCLSALLCLQEGHRTDAAPQPASLTLPHSMHHTVTLASGPLPSDPRLPAAPRCPIASSSRVSSHLS